MTLATDTVYKQRARVRAALDWRPEWPFAVLVLVAWIAMFAGSGSYIWTFDSGSGAVKLPPLDHASHASVHQVLAGAASRSPPRALPGFFGALAEWGLMCVAMMLPVALPGVGHVGVNSLRRRRQRAMAIYVVVYVGIWLVFGVVTLAGLNWFLSASGVDGRILLAAALAIAAAWQVTGYKRRALFECKRTLPLPPMGLRADAGCARFACLQGWRCIKSCWALMMVMVIGGHASLLLTVAMTALVLIEEWTFVGRRLVGLSAGVLAASAALVALVGGGSH